MSRDVTEVYRVTAVDRNPPETMRSKRLLSLEDCARPDLSCSKYHVRRVAASSCKDPNFNMHTEPRYLLPSTQVRTNALRSLTTHGPPPAAIGHNEITDLPDLLSSLGKRLGPKSLARLVRNLTFPFSGSSSAPTGRIRARTIGDVRNMALYLVRAQRRSGHVRTRFPYAGAAIPAAYREPCAPTGRSRSGLGRGVSIPRSLSSPPPHHGLPRLCTHRR
ncbi:hypothetical protein C8Q80DRAFT_207902 [Daedaleopsis nitida]|nr:hypothetical protein C8Q80DRAFT_207902 [Daedaleopsis nitida]